MLNENARKWVEALRSGKYKQTIRVLGRITSAGNRYCCLGVACELAVEAGVIPAPVAAKCTSNSKRINVLQFGIYEDHKYKLPKVVADWLGLRSTDGSYDLSAHSLAKRNDDGATFLQIAKIIEKEPKGLFKIQPKQVPGA